ncbi:unnamed protein product [Ranitomeya imitator]|uniref:Uncharacterized protein n=1 Tax=Ranitomeya imitator TaxID=111125 RepID=A0ABN9L883_9NEOB|nr:unnamed protein product [Ranitomeya imitator]
MEKTRTVESEAKVRTKSRFDEVFESYAALSEAKKKTKKKTPKEEHVILETFSNQLHPAKDRVQETQESGRTRIEEDSPRISKQKARESLRECGDGGNTSTKGQKHAKSEKKKKRKLEGQTTPANFKWGIWMLHINSTLVVQSFMASKSKVVGLQLRLLQGKSIALLTLKMTKSFLRLIGSMFRRRKQMKSKRK